MIVDRIEGYGVVLKRLTEDKIELVRNWRNDPKIQQYMFFRDYITPEMQQAWFAKIDNEYNHYFIIEYKGEEIGLVNFKDVDYENGIAESGTFIYEDKYLNSTLSYCVTFLQFDFGFNQLGLKQILATTRVDNERVHRFNDSLGFVIDKNRSNEDVIAYILNKEDYCNNQTVKRFRAMLSR